MPGVLSRIRSRLVRIKAALTYGYISGVSNGWWPLVREPFSGAWQRNISWSLDTVLAHHAVYSCVTLISSDIGKLRAKLVQLDSDGIWSEVTNPAFSPVLRKPNHYQNHIQFKEWWITSKLLRGNAYALKQRDARGVVTALYLLDPSRVTVLVAPSGDVFYQLGEDNLSGVIGDAENVVPASEIIHDRMNCLFHPLVGVSPIFACGMAADIGLRIERNAHAFFENGSNPSGILTTPVHIDQVKADQLSKQWNAGYSAVQSGRVAILGNDMKFTPLRMSAVDSQMIEHLKWTAETVCSTFHVPVFMVSSQPPTYNNVEALGQVYYQQCLQSLIEQFELCMDEGLGIGFGATKESGTFGVELDLDGLLRMDTATQYKTLGEGIGSGLLAPDEARKKIDLKPVVGGATPYLQQQNFSLAALAKRDRDDPFSKPDPPAPAAQAPSATAEPSGRSVADFAAVQLQLLAYADEYKALELTRAA